jgi:hypothetical protein
LFNLTTLSKPTKLTGISVTNFSSEGILDRFEVVGGLCRHEKVVKGVLAVLVEMNTKHLIPEEVKYTVLTTLKRLHDHHQQVQEVHHQYQVRSRA